MMHVLHYHKNAKLQLSGLNYKKKKSSQMAISWDILLLIKFGKRKVKGLMIVLFTKILNSKHLRTLIRLTLRGAATVLTLTLFFDFSPLFS